jgi:hypothetical protein
MQYNDRNEGDKKKKGFQTPYKEFMNTRIEQSSEVTLNVHNKG